MDSLDPGKVCRSCLGNPEVDEENNLIHDSRLFQLYIRLSNCKLDIEDPLSKSICQACINCLNKFDAFQKMCTRSYQELFAVQRIRESTVTFLQNDGIPAEKLDKCPLYIVAPDSYHDEALDKNIQIDSESKCDLVINLDENYDGKMETFDASDDELLAVKIDKLKQIYTFCNGKISDTDSDKMLIQTSLKSESSSKKKKNICNRNLQKTETPSEKDLDSEQANDNSELPSCTLAKADQREAIAYKCEQCCKKFHARIHYEGHLRKHDGKKPYFCSKCPREYSWLKDLQEHISIEHSDKPILYYCTVNGCERKYSSRHSLNRHLNSHSNPGRIKTEKVIVVCELCGKSLSKKLLWEHMMVHKGIFPHACDVCPKKFRYPYQLEQHKLFHSGIKNYSCPICFLKKTTKKEVTDHMKVHTREKKFACESCTACFLTKANLETHIRNVHLRIKSFHCTICDKLFSKAETLKHHMMTHTGEKPHECPYCKKGFIQKALMKIHARRHEVREC